LKDGSLIGLRTRTGGDHSRRFREDAKRIPGSGNIWESLFQLNDDLLDVYGQAENSGSNPVAILFPIKKLFLLFDCSLRFFKNRIERLHHGFQNKKQIRIEGRGDPDIFSRLGIQEKTGRKRMPISREAMELL